MPPFPELKDPTVFVASPGDVADMRRATTQEFEALRVRVADDLGVGLYRWEVDKSEDGFEDAVPAQEQIYRPSDSLCRAVICILAEKLGTPLGADIPLDSMGDVPASGGFHLVHEWKPGAEAEGGFPLTGTVFEYLTALAAARRSPDGKPPTLLLLVGDDTILTEADPLNANWGLGRLFDSGRARFQQKKREFGAWQDTVYTPQLVQLSNFVRYLKSRGHVVNSDNLVSDETQLREKVRRFLKAKLNYRTRADDRNPFKALEPFDIADLPVFFGRSEWRHTAVTSFQRLWSERGRVPFFGIVGGSGTGKSSLLRAGMMAHLLDRNTLGNFCGDVVRPDDILNPIALDATSSDAFAPESPLARLFIRLLGAVDPASNGADILSRIRRSKAEIQIEHAVEELCRHLNPNGTERRLLVGLDQFESLVDLSLEPRTQSAVRLLFEFIGACLRSGRIGVIYTLQSNRYHILDDDPILGPFYEAGHTQGVKFPPDEAIDEIIAKPFEMVGMRLEPALHKQLRTNILEFAERSDTGRASLLPLISVQLSRLYEASQGDNGTTKRETGRKSMTGKSSADKLVDELDTYVELTLEQHQNRIAVEDAITYFAEQAWAHVKKDTYLNVSEKTIGEMLEPLVRPIGGSDDRIDLPAAHIGSEPAVRRLADALLRRRLLLPESGNRVRLVHEAVLRHWLPARAWLDEQVRVLGFIQIARVRVKQWSESGRVAAALKGDVDEVGEILVKRWNTLTTASLEADERLLREYGLAVLAKDMSPLRLADGAEKRCTHAYIAATYADLTLCQAYIAHDRECVRARNSDGRLPLNGAVASGSLACVNLWLEAGGAVDAADDDGWMPIHTAAWYGHREVLDRLIQAGAKPDATGAGGTTALSLAVQRGHEETVALLIDKYGCNPLERTPDGTVSLCQAAFNGHGAVVRFLLRHPRCSPLDAQDDGWNAVHLAARYGHAPVLEELRRHPAFDPNVRFQDAWAPLHLATFGGHSDAIRVLLACPTIDACVVHNGQSALHLAADAGHETIVGLLLARADVDPNLTDKKRDTPLHRAVLGKHRSVVARLLADDRTAIQLPNMRGITPIGVARQNKELLQILLEDRRVDASVRETDGWTPLLMAAEAGLSTAARRLLAGGLDFSSPTQAADILYFAAGADDAQLARTLVDEHQIDPWVVTSRGANPLHRAITKGGREIVEIILAVQRPSATDLATLDVISAAAMRADRLDILDRLLADGRFSPNVSDGNGRTALHHASLRGNVPGSRRLLDDARTDALAEDSWGRTALELAPARHRTLMEELLHDRDGGRESSAATSGKPIHLDGWRKPSGDELDALWKSFKGRQARIDDKYVVDGSRTEVVCRELPFYGENVILARFRDERWGNQDLSLYFLLLNKETVHRLPGESLPIHDVNQNAPIYLTTENVLEYVDFFGFFVRGDEGPFYIIRSLDDPSVPSAIWEHVNRESGYGSLSELFRPPRYHGLSPEGFHRCSALVFYSNAIFFADFEVRPDGMIEMVSDEPLLGGLPSRINKPVK